MKNILLLILLLTFASCSIKNGIKKNSLQGNEVTQLSIDFLEALRNKQPTKGIKEQLQKLTIEEVTTALDDDPKRFAFWLNIYNAYIQDILTENPELYDNRGEFFRKPRIELLGRTFSFGEIEHGIIRRSQNEYGLGYIRKWFPPSWERKLRVKNRDYRVHFALNCGAKDCPPVAIYDPQSIDDQLDKGSQKYLTKSSEYDINKNTVYITSLFNWFRGDFGGKSGTRKILKQFSIIPTDKKPSLSFKDYDWTLYLDNYVDL